MYWESERKNPVYCNMQYPYDDSGKNPLYDGMSHRIQANSIQGFYLNGRNFYVLHYNDVFSTRPMTTLLTRDASSGELVKIPLTDYEPLIEYCSRYENCLIDEDLHILPENIGLGPTMDGKLLFNDFLYSQGQSNSNFPPNRFNLYNKKPTQTVTFGGGMVPPSPPSSPTTVDRLSDNKQAAREHYFVISGWCKKPNEPNYNYSYPTTYELSQIDDDGKFYFQKVPSCKNRTNVINCLIRFNSEVLNNPDNDFNFTFTYEVPPNTTGIIRTQDFRGRVHRQNVELFPGIHNCEVNIADFINEYDIEAAEAENEIVIDYPAPLPGEDKYRIAAEAFRAGAKGNTHMEFNCIMDTPNKTL